MSASDNASDVAERKKLQAELADAKTDLDDHYYSHSMDVREQALDDEAQAYEESLNNYTEKLRDTLDEATSNMELFMQSVTNSVMINADTVKNEYVNTGVVLDEALVSPWNKAIEQMKGFEKDGLSMMNAWTTEEGFFGKFETNATNQLKSPWSAGTDAANAFKNNVKTAMEEVVRQVKSNVATAKTSLSSLYQDIKTTNVKASDDGGNGGNNTGRNNNNSDNNSTYIKGENVKQLQKFLNEGFGTGLSTDGVYGPATKEAVAKAQQTMKSSLGNWVAVNGKYDSDTIGALKSYWSDKASKDRSRREWWDRWKTQLPAAMYAKGTTGTKKDQFAITDESWIGEEITLAAGKNGQLQYLKKGSAVMPADISANLIEWGKLNPNMMMGDNIVKPIVTNVETKNQALNINFDALVKADNITNDVLPEVEKMVSKQLDAFTRKLNYAIKRL